MTILAPEKTVIKIWLNDGNGIFNIILEIPQS